MTTSSALPKLPDIDDVRPVDASDDIVFNEVREVLDRHNALQRFGLSLLHQHFDLESGETLVESIDKDNRTLILRPKIARTGQTVETSWRLDDPIGQRRCETLCERIPKEYGGGHNRNHYTTG
jgi:hypothetical protein